MKIEENYKWFEENYEELQKKYKNKFLVIKDKKVIKATSSMEEAINYSNNLELGTYIIQKCAKNKDDLIQVFHTRVRFDD